MAVPGTLLFKDTYNVPNQFATNEYAYWNAPLGKQNVHYQLTSGSLFVKDQAAWSGVPDDIEPNATSSNGTNSAVFRLNTKRFDFGDVMVKFKLWMTNQVTTPSTPAEAWDGIHIFLRYQSQYNLYYASVNRRDGHVVIKKKCVGGTENGGTYHAIGEKSGYPIPFAKWQDVAASIKNNTNGSVTIRLYRQGVNVLTATDSGLGCVAIKKAGATGIRGDNSSFMFDNLTVEQI